MASGNFGSVASEHIVQEMWEKWCSSLARGLDQPDARLGRRYPGRTGRQDFILGMLGECGAVAAAEGYAPRTPFLERARGMLTTEGSPLTAPCSATSRSAHPLKPIT